MDDLRSIVVLGRQPALGLAELESLYGRDRVMPVGDQTAALTLSPDDINFERLGGSVKICKVLTRLDTSDWGDIERYLVKETPKHAQLVPEGKLQIGLSVYGYKETPQRIQATGLSLKKAIKKTGRSVRLVPNKEPALTSAQVEHNHLTGETGWELVLVRDGEYTFLAQTVTIQDIASYTIRDRERPKRDTRVGMLPPKLAQIIINLAGNHVQTKAASESDRLSRLLDPFCGTGVLLQEALLMGYDVYGSDLEPRMIDYSNHNLDWFTKHFPVAGNATLEIGDATSWKWQQPVDLVACETYLGKPFTSTPPRDVLASTIADCNQIIKKFLQNIHGQLVPGTRLCIAVPAWQVRRHEFKHLSLVDSLEEIGYNQVRFEHVENSSQSGQLLYYREDQIVARELLVLTRN